MEVNITPSHINQASGVIGIPTGISYGQNERVDELNSRLFDRNHPDQSLKPNFDFRPVSTKYSHFPIIDRRAPNSVPYNNYHEYSTGKFFVPPVGANGPVAGFTNNVNTESILRNQFFTIQRGADQGIYVPNSNSDLYRVNVDSKPGPNPHPTLFDRPTFSQDVNPNIVPGIGKDIFMNNTRTQLRNTL